MTKMKASGIDWIGEIPEEWGVTKFKYLFNTNKGLSITKENLVEVGVPVISYGQIHSKYGKFVDLEKDSLPFVSKSFLANTSALLQQGDFVFADTSEDIVGSGNFSTRLDDNGYLFAGYHTIKASLKKSEQNDFRYFMHLFDSLLFRRQVQSKVRGIKVFSITQSILQNCDVLVPSLAEQKCIADYLDKKVAQLDKVKALLEEQIEMLQDYRQSLIYDTVTKGLDKTVPMKDSGVDWIGEIPEGWEVKRLKYVLQTPLQYGANATGDNYDETLPRYIRITDIDSNGNLKDTGRQSLNEREAFPYILKDGDVLFARSGATVGKTFLYRETYGKSAFAGYLIKAEVNQKMILPEYLVYYTQSYLFDIWKEQSFIQSTIQNIGADKYNNLQIVLCSITEQAEIIEYLNNKVSKINQMIAIKQEQIENINQQRQTLIYDVVTGKKRI
ncbi:restriction endonuclease subunit S [Streptococcus pluranimalium]|uniref:restriction endonuclease subunit S n=1 Tax=Streptococcus pluranimalium TaxID=82348 RepID=UPI0039FC2694